VKERPDATAERNRCAAWVSPALTLLHINTALFGAHCARLRQIAPKATTKGTHHTSMPRTASQQNATPSAKQLISLSKKSMEKVSCDTQYL